MYMIDGRVRICYENGNPVTGKKIYEMHKSCECGPCRRRVNWRTGYANCATATTQDVKKIGEVLRFLDNWTCKKSEGQLKPEYFSF